MAIQIITVLCEGPHDVAFICRILKSIGFKSEEKIKLGDYPPPMNALLQNEAKKGEIQDLNITELRRTILPTNVLKSNDVIYFLYSLGGDGKIEERKKVLRDFRSFIPNEGEIVKERLPAGTILSLIYFFDADVKGVNQRINEINSEIREVLPELKVDLFQNNSEVKIVSELKLGCFIFTGDDNDTGKLEDVLIPLMKESNEPIFEEAEQYLTTHFEDSRLFPLKININNDEIEEIRSGKQKEKVKYDKSKSIIGVVGQLQRSGKSNVVCISDSDFITREKILANKSCKEIITFLTSFITVDTNE